MGLQIIFCVETNNKCESDKFYIRETIKRFFNYDYAMVKFTFVFMGGKYNYNSSAVEKKISRHIIDYSNSVNNRSVVIYCVDCDDYDINQRDRGFLEEIGRYCSDNLYKLVWFCKDIERVYTGEKIPDKEKKKRAVQFVAKKEVGYVNKESLTAVRYGQNRSNILRVLNEFDELQYCE